MPKESEWPRVKRQPDACFQAPGVFEKSERSVAGPLRMGTARGAGPTGRAVATTASESTDHGMDRVTPRGFDPMGTDTSRRPGPESDLISQQIRGGNSRRE